MTRSTVARTLHDVGLAAWFGGTLMGAVGVNGAAADVDDPRQRARVANAGWARWTPVNALAIGAHLTGSVLLLKENRGRVKHQKGVGATSAVKTGLTSAALVATAYSRVLGKRILDAGDVPVDGGTSPSAQTPPNVASAQRQLAALQWALPALTGGVLVVSAQAGEQQRPSEVALGVARHAIDGAQDRLAGVADTVTSAVRGQAGALAGTATAKAGQLTAKAKDAVPSTDDAKAKAIAATQAAKGSLLGTKAKADTVSTGTGTLVKAGELAGEVKAHVSHLASDVRDKVEDLLPS